MTGKAWMQAGAPRIAYKIKKIIDKGIALLIVSLRSGKKSPTN